MSEASADTPKCRQVDSSSAKRLRTGPTLPVLIAVVSAAVSGFLSWQPSFWTDEAVTITAATMPWRSLWGLTQHIDAVHLAYYALMHLWTDVFGTSPLSMRAPSTIAAGITAAGVFVIGRRLTSFRVGMLAAILVTSLPRLTWAAVEARSYAASACFATWATYCAIRMQERSSTRWAVLYASVVSCGALVNAYLLLLVPAHGVALVLTTRDQRTAPVVKWLLASCSAGLVALPLVILMASQQGQLGAPGESSLRLLRHTFLSQFFLGNTPSASEAENPLDTAWGLSAIALAVVCWTVMVVAAVTAVRSGRFHLGSRLTWPFAWVAVPTSLLGAASLASPSLYHPRYLTFTVGGFALCLAHALTWLLGRRSTVMATAAVVALSIPIFWSQRAPTGKAGSDWRAVATFIETDSRPQDVVYFAPIRAPGGTTVGATTRYIAASYPDAFSDLQDLTLLQSPAEQESISGSSMLLRDAVGHLTGASKRIWVVARKDYDLTEDSKALSAAGFHPTGLRFSGQTTVVAEYTDSRGR